MSNEFIFKLKQNEKNEWVIEYGGVEFAVRFDYVKAKYRARCKIAGYTYSAYAALTVPANGGAGGNDARAINAKSAAHALLQEARPKVEARWAAGQAKLADWRAAAPIR